MFRIPEIIAKLLPLTTGILSLAHFIDSRNWFFLTLGIFNLLVYLLQK
jgi:hypothetical protein